MQYYFVSILFLFHVSIFADENPFDVKEDFQAIDRADNSLFSTMKNELDKAGVVPESVMIDFKRNTTPKNEINTLHDSVIPRKDNPYRAEIRVEKEKTGKLLNKKRIKYLKQRKKVLPQKQVKRKKLKTLKNQKKEQNYYEKHVADIDLVKEKRIKRKKLNLEYHKAVKAVDTY